MTSDYYLLPNHKFTCPAGTISGFLLGVEVRNDSSRDQFPSVSLYSPKKKKYSYLEYSNRTISLGANEFSSNGVYEYHLSSNLIYNFNEDYILGVYQPPFDQSAVQLYYDTESGSKLCPVARNAEVMINNKDCQKNRRLLLHPITSKPIVCNTN